jgi:hypothetical protein
VPVRVNGEVIDNDAYAAFHRARFERTLDAVRHHGGGTVVELGGHPWALTARLLAEPGVALAATVSAEEVSAWSDELPIVDRDYELALADGRRYRFKNYSANIERSFFSVGEPVDIVLACEIIEHLTRAPHTMLLNINSWLKPGGLAIITTPNGSQLENPFRVRPKMPAFRPSVYSRHNYVFTMDGLCDLLECCGFEIAETQYWSPYGRKGLTNLYRAVYDLGPRYLKDKLAQTLCIVARKVEERSTASRLPRVYAAQPGWDNVEYASAARIDAEL